MKEYQDIEGKRFTTTDNKTTVIISQRSDGHFMLRETITMYDTEENIEYTVECNPVGSIYGSIEDAEKEATAYISILDAEKSATKANEK